MATIEMRGPLRHECLMSGGCCQANITLLHGEEGTIVNACGQFLNISKPVDGNQVRKKDTGCVFLGAERQCRIHSEIDAAKKPSTCQQFPVVAVQTEQNLRVGIDPGCLSAWKSWKNGPILHPQRLLSTKVALPKSLEEGENNVIDQLGGSKASIDNCLSSLTVTPEGQNSIAHRLLRLIQEARLTEVLMREGTPQLFRVQLIPALIELEQMVDVPKMASPKQLEAWSLEAAQRMIYLRFLAQMLPPQVAAVLVLGGARCLSWSSTDIEVWGPRFAVWNRMLRSPVMLATLFSKPHSIQWLMQGDAPRST